MPQFHTVDEAAAFLEISLSEIRALIRRGDLKLTLITEGCCAIAQVELNDYITCQQQSAEPSLSNFRRSAISVTAAAFIVPLSGVVSWISVANWSWLFLLIVIGFSLLLISLTPTNPILDREHLCVRPSSPVRDEAGRLALGALGGGLVGVGVPPLIAGILDSGPLISLLLPVVVAIGSAIALLCLIRRR